MASEVAAEEDQTLVLVGETVTCSVPPVVQAGRATGLYLKAHQEAHPATRKHRRKITTHALLPLK